MDIGELRGACLALVAQAAAIEMGDVDAWIRELEHQDAVGCFTDPTAWIQTAKPRAVSLDLLRAIRAFKRAIEPAEKMATSQEVRP